MLENIEIKRKTPYLCMGVAGSGGAGKTHFALAAPKLRIAMVQTEVQGQMTKENVEIMGRMNPASRVFRPETWEDIISIMNAGQWIVDNFDFFGLDTSDDIEEMAARSYCAKLKVASLSDTNDHGKSYDKVRQMVEAFWVWLRDLPIHKVILCHYTISVIQGDGDDEGTRMFQVKTIFTKKGHDMLVTKLNVFGLLQFRDLGGDKSKRELLFRSTQSRQFKKPPYLGDMEEADLETILKKHIEYYRAQPAQKATK